MRSAPGAATRSTIDTSSIDALDGEAWSFLCDWLHAALDGPLARDALYPGFCRLDVARLILTWVVGET